jgi:hypothetical protein
MMQISLKDAEGGPEFIDRCTRAVEDMALAFAGEPDERVIEHLNATKQKFESELAAVIGIEAAARIVSKMISAILGEKRRLESLPGSRVKQ